MRAPRLWQEPTALPIAQSFGGHTVFLRQLSDGQRVTVHTNLQSVARINLPATVKFKRFFSSGWGCLVRGLEVKPDREAHHAFDRKVSLHSRDEPPSLDGGQGRPVPDRIARR